MRTLSVVNCSIPQYINESFGGENSLIGGCPMQLLNRHRSPQRRAGFLFLRACSWSGQNRARQLLRRVGLRGDAVGQSQAERRLEPRQKLHALQAAQTQVTVELRGGAEHGQSALAAQFLKQPTDLLQHAFAHRRAVELCDWSRHRTHEGFYFLPREATTSKGGLLSRSELNQNLALFFAACGGENPLGKSVVERSTPERSAPVKSVSRRIATPISAPENFAPFTFANRKFTLRRWVRWKLTFERSQRKNSTPLACASVKSAPGRIASVISVFRRSAFLKFAPERSAPGSLALRRSEPSRLAFRRMAPVKLPPLKSA